MLTVSPTAAQPVAQPLYVTWIGPQDCERRDALVSEMGQILGGSQAHEPLTARVEVTREESGRWHVVLVVDRDNIQSQRAFEAASCDAAVSAAALITAIASDEGVLPQSPPVPVIPRRLASEAPSPAWRRVLNGLQLDVTLGGTGEYGLSPAFAPGAEVSIGGSLPRLGGVVHLRALVTGAYFAPQTDALPGHVESAEFQLVAVSGRACTSFGTARLDVGPCIGGELDRMSGTGVGSATVFTPGEGSATWATLVGSLLASVRLTGDLGLFARFDANVSIAPPHFDVQTPSGRQLADRPSPVAARAAAGVELRFF